MTMCGLLVGSTIFFDTAVILLAPVTIAVARQSKKSIIFFAIPMAIAVLGMHSIVPPHPGAVAIATALNVNFGLLIMYGLLAMVPGVGIAFLYSQWVAKKLTVEGTNRTIDVDAAYDGGGPTAVGAPDSTTPLPDGNARDAGPGGTSSPIATAVATATVRSTGLTALEGHERPAVGKLLFVLLLPIVLILIQTLAGSVHVGGPAQAVLDILTFLGTPWLALTITVFFAYALLLTPRVRRGESISFFGMQGMKPVGEILVSTGGGVAFGSIIGASGVGKQLLDTLAEIHLPLVLFSFVLAAILRATLGTTTAAVTFVAVLLAQAFDTTILNPSQLALLAVGVSAGGMCLSNYSVDLQACTRAGTVATITPDGARGPVATATLSMLLSVLHNTVMKDHLVREKSWDLRERFMGTGLTGKTVGLLGVGNTGGELVRLLQPFGVRCVGYDPFCPPQRAIELGVELMEPEDVAASCDALIVMAVLTEQTRHIVNAAILDQMKSTAVVINMARGPIINEQDLISALASGSIAAAGLDVFETEPVTNELVSMDNVTLSPTASPGPTKCPSAMAAAACAPS